MGKYEILGLIGKRYICYMGGRACVGMPRRAWARQRVPARACTHEPVCARVCTPVPVCACLRVRVINNNACVHVIKNIVCVRVSRERVRRAGGRGTHGNGARSDFLGRGVRGHGKHGIVVPRGESVRVHGYYLKR